MKANVYTKITRLILSTWDGEMDEIRQIELLWSPETTRSIYAYHFTLFYLPLIVATPSSLFPLSLSLSLLIIEPGYIRQRFKNHLICFRDKPLNVCLGMRDPRQNRPQRSFCCLDFL